MDLPSEASTFDAKKMTMDLTSLEFNKTEDIFDQETLLSLAN